MSRIVRASLRFLLPLLISGLLAACGGGGGGGGTGAPPDPPPVGAAPGVASPTATSVDATGATLGGTVTSNGLPTQCWFEYGTDPTLGTRNTTAPRSIDPGAAGLPVADTVAGLWSSTVYYYRICASNSLGTTRSPIGQFMTSSSHACLDCHGGSDGTLPGVDGAPVITRYWQTSGHGKGARGAPLRCDDCHDVSSPAMAHPADGSGTFNTLSWPGKADNTTNANTAHLKGFFFPASPAAAADYAVAFDNACNNRPGCHVRADGSRVLKVMSHAKDGLMQFGTLSTAPDPKIYTWYVQNSYPDDFYRSQSAWVVRDLTIDATGPVQYGTCISCHDPHGTGTTDVSDSTGTNVMVRGEWKGGVGGQFCTGPCHR